MAAEFLQFVQFDLLVVGIPWAIYSLIVVWTQNCPELSRTKILSHCQFSLTWIGGAWAAWWWFDQPWPIPGSAATIARNGIHVAFSYFLVGAFPGRGIPMRVFIVGVGVICVLSMLHLISIQNSWCFWLPVIAAGLVMIVQLKRWIASS
jgi:hypothetical protein